MSLYPPPKDLHAELWTEVPEKFHKRNVRTAWSDKMKFGVTLPAFLEGPSFDREGNLWLVDIPHGRVFKVSPQREWSLVAEYDGEPNGLKIRKDGQVFIADFKHGIMHLDPATGTVTPHCDRIRLERFKGCNDLCFGRNGDLFFTDQGLTGLQDPTGRVFRLSPDGRLECLIDTVPSPNGLVPDLDEGNLFVAVTRANQIWRLPLPVGGGTFKVGVFVQLSGGLAGPDGLALDCKGNLLVAHAGMGCVWMFSALGEPLYRIRSTGGLHITNIAFGGPENRHLYITESNGFQVLRVELPYPGKPMYSHMD